MNDTSQKQLGNTLWKIADDLCGAMDADDFRDYMLSFLFLRYLSDNYEKAAQKELGKDYPDTGGDARKVPLALWYANNVDDMPEFEKQMRRSTLRRSLTRTRTVRRSRATLAGWKWRRSRRTISTSISPATSAQRWVRRRLI